MRVVRAWKGYVARAENERVRVGSGVIHHDVIAGFASCGLPRVAPHRAGARVAALVIQVPALLRTLAIRHADRPDTELIKSITIAVGLATMYVVVRTYLVVEVCS
jgi:hypothetical protein